MYALVCLLIGSDVGRLGSPEWEAREAAEHRLRILGPLAWPRLLEAVSSSESPEVRARADRLLVARRALLDEFRAAAALADPWPPSEAGLAALFADHRVRLRMSRMAKAAGCPGYWAGRLDPENDRWEWWGSVCGPAYFRVALAVCRLELGHDPGWPFR